MFELFRKIVVDFGSSISWRTQPNCRVIFNTATALLSPFFFDLLLGCSSTWRCAQEHFSPNLHPFLDFKNMHSGGCHFSQNGVVFLWANPCTAVEPFYHLGFCLWDFWFSMHFRHSAALKILEKDSAVSILHAYSYRVGNCNCLLSNTAH